MLKKIISKLHHILIDFISKKFHKNTAFVLRFYMVVDWTKVDEIRLLRWFAEFKPAGLHKHFHMCCIVERMNHPDKYPVVLLQKENIRSDKSFTASEIWRKLNQYYNFEAMDKIEDEGRFKEKEDFELPWDEYGDLILDHAKGDQKEEEGESNEDNQTNRSKRRSTRLRKSSRLNHSESDGDEVLSDSEPDDGSDEMVPEDRNNNDQPLAKRTRLSSSTSNIITDNDTSPKMKKRKWGGMASLSQQQETATSTSTSTQPSIAPVRVSSRVSSRLRNKK